VEASKFEGRYILKFFKIRSYKNLIHFTFGTAFDTEKTGELELSEVDD
jgi:hypothetical protein